MTDDNDLGKMVDDLGDMFDDKDPLRFVRGLVEPVDTGDIPEELLERHRGAEFYQVDTRKLYGQMTPDDVESAGVDGVEDALVMYAFACTDIIQQLVKKGPGEIGEFMGFQFVMKMTEVLAAYLVLADHIGDRMAEITSRVAIETVKRKMKENGRRLNNEEGEDE